MSMTLRPGDHVRIKVRGVSYTGKVKSAINWGFGDDSSDWNVEFFHDRDGRPGYWKERVDGGTIEKIGGHAAGRTARGRGRAAGASYKTNDPRGWGGDPSRGAAIGRPTLRGAPSFSGRLTLRRVRLDQGGYDPNGTYFGIGAPLYWYASDDGEIDGMLRAHSREDAKAQVFKSYPHAQFYR